MIKLFNQLTGPSIWIVGSSIIKRAESHFKGRPLGRNLGLQRYQASVIWAGHPGLQYHQVFTIVNSLRQCFSAPNFLILHFGGNDVGREACGILRQKIKTVLTNLMCILPNTTIVWSSILPRLNWRYSTNVKAMESMRARINRAVILFLLQRGHKAIKRTDFHDKLPALYLADGVHLSFIGNDIFLNTIQGALETFFSTYSPMYP